MNDLAKEFVPKNICDKIELYELGSYLFDSYTCILYAHIVPKELTGTIDKYYIGITKRTFKRRCGIDGNCYKSSHFRNAIKKYGWDNIKHIVISDKLLQKQTQELEVELIKYFNSTDRKYGYNISKGGSFGGNVKPTLKVYRYKPSGEYIDSFDSAADAGRFLDCDRGTISHAVDKNYLSKGFQWRSYKVDNCGEHIRSNQKSIYQYDLNWNFIQEFSSYHKASVDLKIPIGSISHVVNKPNRIAYGFHFMDNKIY